MTNYPGTLDTIETLFGNLTDVATTTLNNAINTNDLTVTVTDPAKFPLSRQIILIDNELIIFASRAGNVFSVEQRGAYGTTAAAHASGTRFRLIYSAAHHNTIVEAVLKQQLESQYFRSPVESDIVTDPSMISPIEGQQWIVPAGAIGLWAGQEGKIARWSDPGYEFIVPLDGMSVYIRSRDGVYSWNGSIWKTVQTQEQRNNQIHNMRTGLISGGRLVIGTDPTKFNIEVGSAYFVDSFTDPVNPTYKFMEWNGVNDIPATLIPTSNWTFVSLDATGNLIQSPVPPTTESLRDTVFIGVLYHRDRTEITDISFTPTNGVYAYIEQDFLDIERLFNKVGNAYGPGSLLTIQKSSGQTFGPSVNYSAERKDPNLSDDAYVPVSDLYYRSRLAGNDFQEYAVTQDADPDQYDLDAVLTPVPAGAWTVQRIFWNPNLQKTVITYGQKVYPNQQEALFDIDNPGVIDSELGYDSTFRGCLIVQQGTLDLTDTSKAIFLDSNIIGQGAAGSGEVNSGQNIGGGVEVYKTKLAVFLVFRTFVSDTAAITITQNADTINFDFIPSAVDHQTLSNVGINTHDDIDTFIADINTYIDPRVILRESPNVVKVRSNPNPGEFASVAAAVASITTATEASPWVVSVAPGTYLEPTIVMKPFVLIVGQGTQATILQASNPADDLIIGSYGSGIYALALTGSTGTGAALVRFNNSVVPLKSFVMNTIRFIEGDTLVSMDVTAPQAVSAIIVDSTFGGTTNAFRTGFLVKKTGPGLASLAMNAVVSNGLVSPHPLDVLVIDGAGARVIGGNWIFQALSPAATNGIRMRNGASLAATGVNFNNLANGIFIENVGTGANVQSDATSFNNCVADVRVEQPTATGYVSRPSTRSKLFLDPATSVYVPGVDLQVVNVAKRGGDFTSVKAAVDSITDASPTKTYTVHIGPGVFIEDTITMKPFVTINGEGDVETIIEANGPNKHLIVAVAGSSIRNCGLRGTSGAGFAAVYHAGTGVLASFIINRCAFGTNEQFVINDSTGGASITRIDSCRIVGGFITGFTTIGPVALAQLVFLNTTFQAVAPTIADVCLADGPGAAFIIGNVLMSGTGGVGNGIRATNGANIKIIGAGVENFDKGVFVENVGAGSVLSSVTLEIAGCTTDIQIDHPGATGSVNGAMDAAKVLVDPAASVVFAYSDPSNGSFTATGEFYLGPNAAETVEVSELFIKAPAMGLLVGGTLSDGGGLTVNVAAGTGYTNSIALQKIKWPNTSIVLPANTAQYVYFNSNGILVSGAGFPDTRVNILLGRVVTNASAIEILDLTPFVAEHASNRNDTFARIGLGVVYDTGSIVTATPARNLNVTSGSYFLGGNRFLPSGGSSVSLRTHYRDGVGGFILGNSTVVDNGFYDNNSGVLAPLTASWYAKHAIYTVGQGVNEKYLLVYAQSQYADLTVTEQANIPAPPSYFTDGIVLIASVIVQQGVATVNQVRDERPVLGFKSAGIAASSDHGNLLGLTDDDHLQYLRTDGGRTMTGDLDMGGNNIVNAPLINGVDIPAHASRHQPNGADPIPTAAGLTILPNNVNGVGTSNNLARADHVHALTSGTPVTQTPDQANAVGTANSVARADHVHNIPTDAPVTQAPETGNIEGVAASFARADHQHDIPTDAPVTALSATTANAEGTDDAFSRADHVHSILTAAPATQNPDQANAVGSASELARADHIHNIPTDAPTTTLSPATANAEGTGTSFARNDHTHAIASALAATISSIEPDDAADAGVSSTFARGDHQHAIVAAAPTTPLSATTTNAEGAGTAFARNDHSHAITTAAPSAQAPDQANAVGTAAALARADHIHQIPTAAPVASISATTANGQGTGLSFARNDHQHNVLTGVPSSQAPDTVNATGSSANLARADHVHLIPTASAVGLNVNSTNTQGAAATFARADHTHAIASGTAVSQPADQANSAGVSANLARADHVHNIATAAPTANLSATTGNGQGTALTFAKSDHSHALSTGAASTQTPDQANAVGVSANLARADHVHTIATAVAIALDATSTVGQGASTSFSRADHSHSIASGAPSTQNPDQANAAGTSVNFARADHKHNIPTASAVSLTSSSTNTQGVSTSFARADHTHSISLDMMRVADATTLSSTTSATFVLIPGMTITPPAGQYLVQARTSLLAISDNRRISCIIYAAGVAVADSEVLSHVHHTPEDIVQAVTDAIVTVDGTQAIEFRWRVVNTGTGQSQYRSMVITKKGN